MKKVLIFFISIPKYICKGFVYLYKVCISPLLPHACRFTPSCSTYALQAFKEWGFFKGLMLSIKRVFRCNPTTKGGLDVVKTNPKGDYKWLM